VVHSTTKFLNGHSDSIGGVAVCRKADDDVKWLKFVQNAQGAILSPARLVPGDARDEDAGGAHASS
jgi:cystathionine beta-lyase/cystathionine gamma-synthase